MTSPATELSVALAASQERVRVLEEELKDSRMPYETAWRLVQKGFDQWKDKPHNARWFRKIDGTPIPNDLLVNIATVLAAAPAKEGE